MAPVTRRCCSGKVSASCAELRHRQHPLRLVCLHLAKPSVLSDRVVIQAKLSPMCMPKYAPMLSRDTEPAPWKHPLTLNLQQSWWDDMLAMRAQTTCTVPPPIACLALGTGRSSGPPAGALCSGADMLLLASAGCGTAAMTGNAVADLWLAAGIRAACRSCTACNAAQIAYSQWCALQFASPACIVPTHYHLKVSKAFHLSCRGSRLTDAINHSPEL